MMEFRVVVTAIAEVSTGFTITAETSEEAEILARERVASGDSTWSYMGIVDEGLEDISTEHVYSIRQIKERLSNEIRNDGNLP